MRKHPRHVRPRNRPPEDDEGQPRAPSNRSATLGETVLGLTWSQRLRKWWNDRVPRTQEVNTLFIPTGRHQVRLDWRHRLAIPFVVTIVVLSPLLLILAALAWIAEMVEVLLKARRTKGRDRT